MPPAAAATAATAAIASYHLFGESAELPDVLHCETIAARSSLHDWELAPHRHARLHQVLLVSQGGGVGRLEDRERPLAAGTLVNVPVGSVHAFRFLPGTEGWVVTMADELLQLLLAQAGDARQLLAQPAVVRVAAAVGRLVAQLATEYTSRAPGRALVLRGLACTLLGRVVRVLALQPRPAGELHESDLLRRFEALLELHHLEHWGVAAYARALAVSPTHLSRVTRAARGQGASRLIEERLVREARRQLAYTQLRVKTVADSLGFADPAHFSRVFTRATGCSPRAYRQQLQAGR